MCPVLHAAWQRGCRMQKDRSHCSLRSLHQMNCQLIHEPVTTLHRVAVCQLCTMPAMHYLHCSRVKCSTSASIPT